MASCPGRAAAAGLTQLTAHECSPSGAISEVMSLLGEKVAGGVFAMIFDRHIKELTKAHSLSFRVLTLTGLHA
jgi:hypothetical protein